MKVIEGNLCGLLIFKPQVLPFKIYERIYFSAQTQYNWKTSRTKSENGLALHMEKSQLKKKYVKSQLKLFQFEYASLK